MILPGDVVTFLVNPRGEERLRQYLSEPQPAEAIQETSKEAGSKDQRTHTSILMRLKALPQREQRPRSGLLPSERTGSDNSPDTRPDQEALTHILEWLTDADCVFARKRLA